MPSKKIPHSQSPLWASVHGCLSEFPGGLLQPFLYRLAEPAIDEEGVFRFGLLLVSFPDLLDPDLLDPVLLAGGKSRPAADVVCRNAAKWRWPGSTSSCKLLCSNSVVKKIYKTIIRKSTRFQRGLLYRTRIMADLERMPFLLPRLDGIGNGRHYLGASARCTSPWTIACPGRGRGKKKKQEVTVWEIIIRKAFHAGGSCAWPEILFVIGDKVQLVYRYSTASIAERSCIDPDEKTQ